VMALLPARELAREGNRAITYACQRARARPGNQTARERIDREPAAEWCVSPCCVIQ
jgi:hypothetical protein